MYQGLQQLQHEFFQDLNPAVCANCALRPTKAFVIQLCLRSARSLDEQPSEVEPQTEKDGEDTEDAEDMESEDEESEDENDDDEGGDDEIEDADSEDAEADGSYPTTEDVTVVSEDSMAEQEVYLDDGVPAPHVPEVRLVGAASQASMSDGSKKSPTSDASASQATDYLEEDGPEAWEGYMLETAVLAEANVTRSEALESLTRYGNGSASDSSCLPAQNVSGYVVSEDSLARTAFSVQVACAVGFQGLARVSACEVPGKPYQLSGCEAETTDTGITGGACLAANATGYLVTETSLQRSGFEVSAVCLPGWTGQAQAKPCKMPGETYQLVGCEAASQLDTLPLPSLPCLGNWTLTSIQAFAEDLRILASDLEAHLHTMQAGGTWRPQLSAVTFMFSFF